MKYTFGVDEIFEAMKEYVEKRKLIPDGKYKNAWSVFGKESDPTLEIHFVEIDEGSRDSDKQEEQSTG